MRRERRSVARRRQAVKWGQITLITAALFWCRTMMGQAALAAPGLGEIARAAAEVEHWTAPIYPSEALRAKVGGQVTVRAVVDEVGNVIAARAMDPANPKLGDAAVAAVKIWKFSPAVEHGKAIQVCLDVPIEFDPAKGQRTWKASAPIPAPLLPQLVLREEAVAKFAPPGEYPPSLAGRGLVGRVSFSCVIRPDGAAQNYRILAASHPEFVSAALANLERWKFSPATQGDLRVASEMTGVMKFETERDQPVTVLAANDITSIAGIEAGQGPALEHVVDPVWPYSLLLEGEGGSAAVEFTLNEEGKVSEASVREATRPEYGSSLLAAVRLWTFSAGASEGHLQGLKLLKRAEFKAIPIEAKEPVEEPLIRLVQLARAGEIRGGVGLDEKVTPLYQVTAVYPAPLLNRGKPKGRALVEFVVDRDGRCRLIRIVSATEDEFGWAAATAVSQWIFKVPTRGGVAGEVRVQIPFNFVPPEG